MADDAWEEVARATGMSLAYVLDAHVTATTFHTLQREMKQGRAARGTRGATPWLHGSRRDVEIVVRMLPMAPTFAAAKPTEATHTAAVAEIDPPLFAGMRMFSRDLVTFFGPARGEVPSGHPSLDSTFLTYAFDVERVRELLLPQGLPDRLGEAIAHASRSCSIVVKDSSVEAISLGAGPVAERIEGLADIASTIAREISARARTLRHTPLEVQAREAWQRLAASLGLSVDPLRWHVFGRLGDVEVSVMLEGSPPGVSTTFRAQLRSRLPYALLLRRGFRDKGLWGGGGAPMGHPELDALLVLQASHRPQACALFADPALRQLLAEEARTSNLVLDDQEIVLGRGGFAGTKEIARRLQALVAIVDRLTPRLAAAGPFR